VYLGSVTQHQPKDFAAQYDEYLMYVQVSQVIAMRCAIRTCQRFALNKMMDEKLKGK